MNKKISIQIIGVTISIYLILLIAIGNIIYSLIKDNELKHRKEIYYEITKQVSYNLKNWLQEHIRVAKILADDNRVIETLLNPNDKNKLKEATNFLKSIHKKYPFYENIVIAIKLKPNKSVKISVNNKDIEVKDGGFIVDTVDGKTIGKCNPNFSYIKAIYEGKSSFISEVYPSILRKNPIFVISVPIIVDGKLMGVLALGPQMNYFTEKFVESIKIGKSGYGTFLDDRGMIISHPNKKYILNQNFTKETSHITKEIFKNIGQFIEKFNGTKKIYNSLEFDSGNLTLMNKWYIVIAQNYDEAMKSANNFLDVLIIISLIFFIIFTITIYILMNHIILNPLAKVETGLLSFFRFLNRKSEDIKHIDLNSKNEFGVMAKVINENIENIKNGIKKDDELIEETTKVLEKIQKGEFNSKLLTIPNNPSLNKLKNMMNEVMQKLQNKINEEIEKNSKKDKLLFEQSKMASMGEMIGNIAHQWRQPLNALGVIIQKIEFAYHRDRLNEEFMQKSSIRAMKLINKMSTTIDDFRNFFKPNKRKREFKLKNIINENLSLIDASFKNNNILIDVNLSEDFLIYGFVNEFSQVLINILNNAKDILIEKNTQNANVKIEAFRDNNFVQIDIIDNGGGIDEKNISKIFDPYFSTKDEGKGTGIGLYMSKMIIEKSMKGEIYATNINGGAKFSIKLPLIKN